MSGAFSFESRPEMRWNWRVDETEEQRREWAVAIRAIYALVDPNGWDARRLRALEEVA